MEDALDFAGKILKKAGQIKVPSTYLFLGASDSLSSNIVRQIQLSLEVKKEDITSISPADSEGRKELLSIKQARELSHAFSLTPSGKVRIGVIYDCDKMSIAAANALLKLLEEPPKFGILLLFSKTDNIIDTIKSRATTINCYSDSFNREIGLVQFLIGKDFHEQSRAIENIVKENQVDLFLDQMQSIYSNKMRQSLRKKYIVVLKDIESARKKIQKNANPRLTLECLIIKHNKVLNNVN